LIVRADGAWHQQTERTLVRLSQTDQTSEPDSDIIASMPETGERGEIPGRANAHEAQVVEQSKKLSTRTRQASAKVDAKKRLRSAEASKKQPRNLRRTP
jgi:hypothetical protein